MSLRPARLARHGLLLAACGLYVGCAGPEPGTGRPFDTRRVDALRTGVQDKHRIHAWFGQPVRIEKLHGHPAGCTQRWIYAHARSTDGRKTNSESLVVDFDANALVCDHAYVEN